ncbi:MAG: DUF4339 domain-containing protein, partial [Actinobacteria bacterium]|nr:DUF4339 domain-containing protein [Actinomycetota bacterium]
MGVDSMSSDWRYLKQSGPPGAPSGEQAGPFTWEGLYLRAQAGEFGPNDLVWHPQLPDWTPAAQVPGLFPARPAGAPTAAPATMPPTYAPGSGAAVVGGPRGRGRRLLPFLIPLITLIVVGGGLGAYLGFFYDNRTTKGTGEGGGGTSTTVVSQTTTTESEFADLGVAECKAIDPATLVETADWGATPVNRVCVVLKEGKSRTEAEAVAKALGGSVVGQIEFVNLFEIETAATTEAELQAAIDQAGALPEVQSAMANVELTPDTEIWGVRQSPLNDPVYADGRDGGYKLIGADKAWTYIRGSGLEISGVHAGFVDDGLWKAGGDFDGESYVDFPDHGAAETPPNQVTFGIGA